MNIPRIAATLALSVALGANAQARFDMPDKSDKAEVAEAICAGANPADHGTAIKVGEGSAQRRPVDRRAPKTPASRPPSRIVTIDPLLPFGQ
jgi:hypothetical protein